MVHTKFSDVGLDVDALTAAIETHAVIMVEIDSTDTPDGITTVTAIKKHNRQRKDGLQRYILECRKYNMVDIICHGDGCCGCGGNMMGWNQKSSPLTIDEIADNFYIYLPNRLVPD